MRSTLILSLAALVSAAPAPQIPGLPSLPMGLLNLIPKYLNNPPAGACDVSKAQLPASALAAPDAGLTLALVALGRGTQNYTCASSTSADKPVAAGALANLFDANCFAAHISSGDLGKYTTVKETVPKDAASQFPLPLAGEHFFVDATTPTFALTALGTTEMKKLAAAPAPNPTADVPWLKLVAQTAGTTSKVMNVYRVNTVSGVAPATCDGQQSAFTVQYAADYYFYTSS